MRNTILRATTLASAVAACLPYAASAQLEEILVTATRRETNLQDTPLSIQAFTAEQLELSGITNGRDLGIMVPNVVLNPGTGGAQSQFVIRGLPGVGLYVDGVWQDGFGFQQMNFTEMERIEVLRGPQGTLFGRNTNGGAVNMTTKKPADEFGARVKLDVGDFNRRDASLAVDLPITDTLKTKFMAATAKNDGFIEGLTTPWDFGSQDDTILRADMLWKPTDAFSLRLTYNDEQKRGTDPKIHRSTRYDNSKTYAYNIMLGAFQTQANARCATLRDLHPTCRHARRSGTTDLHRRCVESAARQFVRDALHGHEADVVYAGHAHDELPGEFPGRAAQRVRQLRRPAEQRGSAGRDVGLHLHAEPVHARPGFRTWPDRQMADEVRLDGGRHHGRSRVLHRDGRLEHHRQPAVRGDLLQLGAVSTPGHRFRRHGVPDHDGRHPAAAREPDDRAPSLGLGVQRSDQLDRRLLLARPEI